MTCSTPRCNSNFFAYFSNSSSSRFTNEADASSCASLTSLRNESTSLSTSVRAIESPLNRSILSHVHKSFHVLPDLFHDDLFQKVMNMPVLKALDPNPMSDAAIDKFVEELRVGAKKMTPKKLANLLGRIRYNLRGPEYDRVAINRREQYVNSLRGLNDLGKALLQGYRF